MEEADGYARLPKLLPPPHIFIGSIADQGKFFNTATRWQIGRSMADGPTAFESVMITIGATTMRVFAGLAIASVLAIGTGVLVRYYVLFDRLVLPTVTLLSPVSPIAWLPVAIFIFGSAGRTTRKMPLRSMSKV